MVMLKSIPHMLSKLTNPHYSILIGDLDSIYDIELKTGRKFIKFDNVSLVSDYISLKPINSNI